MDRKEYEKLYEQLLEAAHGEDEEAIYTLARMYYHGIYVRRDRVKAFRYYEQAFAAGVDIDTEDLIYMGNEKVHNDDFIAALVLFNQAAKKGEEFGYECMGDVYFRQEKYEKAWEFFNKPKNKTTLAMYHIGYMYENGLFLEKDRGKARSYYKTIIEENKGDPICELDDSYQRAVEAIKRMGDEVESA